MRLAGKTAVITGAGSGFGAGIARKFAAEGARVMVVDIDATRAEQVAREVDGVACEADVSRESSVAAMAAAARAEFGRVDILVNNAGVTHLPMAMEDVTLADFDRVLAVNAKSVFLTARHFVPQMKAAKAGACFRMPPM